MARLTKDYRESLREDLRDPHEAVAYLQAALEDGAPAGFLLALHDVAEAWLWKPERVWRNLDLAAMTNAQLLALAMGDDPQQVLAMEKA